MYLIYLSLYYNIVQEKFVIALDIHMQVHLSEMINLFSETLCLLIYYA